MRRNLFRFVSVGLCRLFGGLRLIASPAAPAGGGAEVERDVAPSPILPNVRKHKVTILCGGSLGSCVDEERSQLR